MSSPLGRSFSCHITTTFKQLQTISEQRAQMPFREGGWLRKQILGHLIDSALNNHQRFVRASLDGSYTGPSYQQDGWVAIHGYEFMAWPALLEHWHLQNQLLSDVVDRIPSAAMDAQCCVGNDSPVTLSFLVDDYLRHLAHHLSQIMA